MTASDSDSDSQDESQMRQFLEAADHTLLNNAMFQPKTKSDSSNTTTPPPQAQPQPKLKSNRHLEHEESGSRTGTENDLQFSQEMQTHFWNRLSQIIQNQVEFCQIKNSGQSNDEIFIPGCVKLVSNAKCYLNTEIVDTEPAGPLKKPIIKKRRLSEETNNQQNEASALAACAVSSQEILEAADTNCWAKRKSHPNKFFEYKSNDRKTGQELLPLHGVEVLPTNEFTSQRLKNKWDESKICQKRRLTNKIMH